MRVYQVRMNDVPGYPQIVEILASWMNEAEFIASRVVASAVSPRSGYVPVGRNFEVLCVLRRVEKSTRSISQALPHKSACLGRVPSSKLNGGDQRGYSVFHHFPISVNSVSLKCRQISVLGLTRGSLGSFYTAIVRCQLRINEPFV